LEFGVGGDSTVHKEDGGIDASLKDFSWCEAKV